MPTARHHKRAVALGKSKADSSKRKQTTKTKYENEVRKRRTKTKNENEERKRRTKTKNENENEERKQKLKKAKAKSLAHMLTCVVQPAQARAEQ